MIGRRSDSGLRLRLDANYLGESAPEFSRYVQALDTDIFAIEEPGLGLEVDASRLRPARLYPPAPPT